MHAMNYRTPILMLIVALASSAFAQTKPNLLIICTDEHNFRTLGCYRELHADEQAYGWGDSVAVETPHIDSLARDGVLCTSYYGTTPLCTPARASMMTGFFPHATGVPINHVSMDDHMTTFAEVLRRQGYKTGYFGKWHLDGELTRQHLKF